AAAPEPPPIFKCFNGAITLRPPLASPTTSTSAHKLNSSATARPNKAKALAPCAGTGERNPSIKAVHKASKAQPKTNTTLGNTEYNNHHAVAINSTPKSC